MRKVVEDAKADKPAEIELPPIAAALLLDEWRRATMDGQGGWFVRLPRERYDGAGNLWSVVRRSTDDGERIVLRCERRQYQAMASSNERLKVERDIARLQKVLAQSAEELDRFRRSKDTLKAAQLNETVEALEADVDKERERLAVLQSESSVKDVQEWKFRLDLKGEPLKLLCPAR